MGADQIYMQLNGIVSDKLVQRTMDLKARENREENGHRDGYSGDWQCVSIFKRVSGTFKNKEEAMEYLNENCEKWGPALVVQYLTNDKSKPTIRTIISAVVPC